MLPQRNYIVIGRKDSIRDMNMPGSFLLTMTVVSVMVLKAVGTHRWNKWKKNDGQRNNREENR